MKCPECGSMNGDTATRCDCGYILRTENQTGMPPEWYQGECLKCRKQKQVRKFPGYGVLCNECFFSKGLRPIPIGKPSYSTKCPECGLVNPKITTECDCGHAFSAETRTPVPTTTKYKGVGGWLLFFCLCLTLFAPLGTMAAFVAGFDELSRHFGQYPGLRSAMVIDVIVRIGLVCFSVWAGIALWTIRPNAVDIAKSYLIAVLIFAFFESFLLFSTVAGLPFDFSESMKEMIPPYIGFHIWYSYLKNSKRVKATYRIS